MPEKDNFSEREYALSLTTSINGLDKTGVYLSVYSFIQKNNCRLILDKRQTSSPIAMESIIERMGKNLSFKTPQQSIYRITYRTYDFNNGSNIAWHVHPEENSDFSLIISISSQADYEYKYHAPKVKLITHLSLNGNDPVCTNLKRHIEYLAIEAGLELSLITT